MSGLSLPRPMVNLKPVRKKDTAAERFTADHQERYETYGRFPDQIEAVERHNRTYPSMRTELEKRRDVDNHRVLGTSYSRQSRQRSSNAVQTRTSSKSIYCSNCARLLASRPEQLRDLAPRRHNRDRRSILKRNHTRNPLRRGRRIIKHSRPKHFKVRTMNLEPTTKESDESIKSDLESVEDEHKEYEHKDYEVEKIYSKRALNSRAMPVTIRNSTSTVDSNYRNYKYDHESRGTSYHSYHSMNHEPML